MITIRKLIIPINCGDKTCYKEKGVPCKQIRTLKYGQIWICNIFEKELEEDEDGWLKRLEECLKYEDGGNND